MKNLTTEAPRHGGNRVIGRSRDRVIGYRVAAFFGRSFSIVRAAVREIFDESAYERFLARTQSDRTVASYRAFLRERDTAIAQKPRCC